MPDIVNVFPLSVYRDTLSTDPAWREQMVQTVLEMGSQPLRKSQGLSWTGDVNGFEFLHRDPRFVDLFGLFTKHMTAYLEFLAVDPAKLHLFYTRSWATISHGGERIKSHSHKQSHISLVYYLKKPQDSGGISFLDRDAPNQFAPHLFREEMVKFGILKEIQQFNAHAISLEPGEDDVLIFPSKALHETMPSKSREPRVSIAVDIVATLKDSTGLEYMLPDPDQWTPVG